MSTTPSTSKAVELSYTVVGGSRLDRVRRYSHPLTVLLLNRGGKFYRSELLNEVQAMELGEIICVEGPQVPYDIEPLSRQFPEIRFLLFQREASVGEKINLAIEEARSRFILVAWSDMKISSPVSAALLEGVEKTDALCTVPLLRSPGGEVIPSIQVPAWINGRRLELIPWAPEKEGVRSIMPFDFCGIYHKLKFQLTEGFDVGIRNPYWQKLDFGIRTALWGETIMAQPALQLHYVTETPSEDSTPDEGYKSFYLKNLAVRLRDDRGVLPRTRLIRYMLRSDTGPLYSLKEFREVRKWVEKHQYRFKKDASRLIGQWKPPE